MTKNARSLLVLSAPFLSIWLAAYSAAQASDDPCTAKSFEFDEVEAACASGGRKETKKLMKSAVAKAKADGKKMNCKSCHEDLKTFSLTSNAVDDLRKWL